MKITLEYYDDAEMFRARCALHASELWSALHDVDIVCRSRMKHGKGVAEDEYAILENIRELAGIARQIEEMM